MPVTYMDLKNGRTTMQKVKQINPITTDKEVSFAVEMYKADHTGTLKSMTPRA